MLKNNIELDVKVKCIEGGYYSDQSCGDCGYHTILC